MEDYVDLMFRTFSMLTCVLEIKFCDLKFIQNLIVDRLSVLKIVADEFAEKIAKPRDFKF